MHRFRILLSIVFVAASAASPRAQAQTTLNATLSSTPLDNTASLATGSGLTLNLSLGIDYLIVGGGGGGGSMWGGGGGAGAVRSNVGGTALPQAPGSYGVTIGAGGTGATDRNTRGGTGGSSGIFGLTASGGGGGGSYIGNITPRENVGGSGASGGGSAPTDATNTSIAGGTGTAGNNGGSGFYLDPAPAPDYNRFRGGGGGGAGTVGTSGGSTTIGNGGSGITSAITGVTGTYAAGGGGGNEGASAAPGGSGIGGIGGFGRTSSVDTKGGNGAAGTGSGGGGSAYLSTGVVSGGTGGSGVVVVRYRSATDVSSGGDTFGTYSDGTNTWYYERFTNSGTLALTYNAANLLATQSGAISGTGRLTYDSPGTLALTASNSYSGGTTISAGTLQIGASGTAGTIGSGAVTNNATLAFNRSNALPVSNNISGSGALRQDGLGTTTLSGTNTYSGETTISAGTLQVGASGTAGTLGGGNVNNNATLRIDRSDTFTLSNNISGSGGLVNVGGAGNQGTTILVGTNTYSGTTTISTGAVQIGNNGAAGTLGSGDVNMANSNAFLVFRRTGSLTVGGNISGSGQLQQFGTGTVTLSGSNSYSGGTRINAGVLALGSANALGSSGTISFTGGTLQFSASNTTDYSGQFSTAASQQYAIDTNGENVSLGSALTSSGGSLTKTGAGTLTLGGANTYGGGTVVSAGRLVGTTASLQGLIANAGVVEFSQATNGTYAGIISGTGSLTKSDAGRVTLSGANTFAGATTVAAGTLATSAAGRLLSGNAVAITTGATLELGGSQTLAVVTGSGTLDLAVGTLTVGTTTGEFSGSITGAGNLTKSGVGVFTLSGSSTFSGDVTVSGGTLVLDNNAALNAANDVSLISGATLTVNAGRTVRVNSFTLTQGTLSGAGSLEALTTTVDSATIDTPIEDAPGQSSNFVKTGTGTTTVNAANTFTGTVDVQAGTVQLGSGGSFAPASSLQLASGATLDLAGRSQTFASVSGTAGTIALGAGTLSVNAAAANTFGGVITGSGGLTKQGVGNFVLFGSSTYSGATSVAAGRLSVNGILGNSPVTVLALAELGGSGSIAGPVSIAAGGSLSPGNSIASLATGTASFASGATFEYEVDSTDLGALGTAADLLVVNGDLNIGNGTLLTFLDLDPTPQYFPEDTTIFALINYSGAWNGGLFTYGSNVLTDGERFMVGEQQWEIDYNRTSPTGLLNFTGDYLPSSSFVAITAVPEPSTLVLMAIGAGLAAWIARPRRKNERVHLSA